MKTSNLSSRTLWASVLVYLVSLASPGVAEASGGKGCPAGMAPVKAGSYTVTRRGYPQLVSVKRFCIDVESVTVRAYGRCVKEGACRPTYSTTRWNDQDANVVGTDASFACNADRKDRQDHPVNCVTFDQATAYCASLGKRLPAENEWEWAARGARKASYPWGEAAPRDDQLCWSASAKRDGTCPVGQFAAGESPQGVKGLSGNVSNWTSTAYATSLSVYDCSGLRACRIVRGSDFWATRPEQVSSSARTVAAMVGLNREAGIGFRCAADR
ncbi:MAG TPA: SUMF1/EgtB/PvdO family nonheme iron enzyme [Anaeromyxobacteraceae bacterium]